MKKLIKNAMLVFFYTLFLVHSAHGALWHKNVMDFYAEGARHIFQGATKEGARTVLLLPEVNKSKYHCACPCNEGIASALYKLVNSENHGGWNIVLWKGDIAPFRGWSGRLFLSGKKVDAANDAVSPKGGWYRLEKKGDDEYRFIDVAKQPTDAYRVRLIIEDVELDKNINTFKALFKIVKEDGEALFEPDNYIGTTKQLRWFITEKPGSWLFYVLSLLFVLSCLWLIILLLLPHPPNPETMIFSIFILIGVLISLLLIYINPFHRENAAHYEQTSLVFMVDNNSEIFFSSGSSSNNLVYIIKKTCLDIGDKFAPSSESSTSSSFWRWCKKHLPLLLYNERRYKLNSQYGYRIHTFSGALDAASTTTMYKPLRSRIDFEKDINKDIMCDEVIREPRLIIPQEELLLIQKKTGTEIAREGNQYVIFYTSSSASCQEDVDSYLKRVTEHVRGAMKVFSIFLPTIPRTGFNSHYNYQHGKLSLLKKVSNHIVSINRHTGGDVDSCIPIFKWPDLDRDIESRNKWDKPQDLDEKRNEYFGQTDEKKLGEHCKSIMQEFKDFVEKCEPVSSDEKELQIQVLAKKEFHLISMMIIICLVGFGMFSYYQYNTTSLDEWENNRNYRRAEYGCLIFSYLALLFLASYWILYSGDDPQRTVYFGYPKLVFWGTIGFWLCFFFGPFIVFRFHLVGKRPMGKGSMELKWALLSSLCFIGVIMIAVLEIPQRIDNIGWRIIATIGVSIAPLLIVFLLDLAGLLSGVIPEQTRVIPVPGQLAWWRKPFWVSLIKLSVGLCLAFVLYGSLWANPGSPFLKFPLFPLNCSYYVFALLGGGLWAMIGIAIWAVYRYKMN